MTREECVKNCKTVLCKAQFGVTLWKVYNVDFENMKIFGYRSTPTRGYNSTIFYKTLYKKDGLFYFRSGNTKLYLHEFSYTDI